MSKLDVLEKLIGSVLGAFKLPEQFSADNNQVSAKASVELSLLKNEKPVTFNGPVIIINADSDQGRQIVKKIYESADQLLEKDERVIEAEFGSLISGAKPHVDSEEAEDKLIEQFKTFVPASDIPIIKAALFIRRLFRNGATVDKYKALIYQEYGSRGNNISNLISADYYEDYLAPFYEHLVETEGALAKSVFNEIYEEAVTQYPFAVFVSITKTYAQIKDEVTKKIKLNILSDQHILNIHGIGKMNKRTIVKLLKDEDIVKFYVAEADVVELEKTVYARIYF